MCPSLFIIITELKVTWYTFSLIYYYFIPLFILFFLFLSLCFFPCHWFLPIIIYYLFSLSFLVFIYFLLYPLYILNPSPSTDFLRSRPHHLSFILSLSRALLSPLHLFLLPSTDLLRCLPHLRSFIFSHSSVPSTSHPSAPLLTSFSAFHIFFLSFSLSHAFLASLHLPLLHLC